MTDTKISDANPIHFQDATALAALIRTRQLSSREVVQAHLDRIGAANPRINAVVTLLAGGALKSADIADKAVADGAALGPAARRSFLDQGLAGYCGHSHPARLQIVRGQHSGQGRHRRRALQSGRRHSSDEGPICPNSHSGPRPTIS